MRAASAALLAAVGVGYAVAGIFPETNSLHWQLGAPLVYGGATVGFLLAGLLGSCCAAALPGEAGPR